VYKNSKIAIAALILTLPFHAFADGKAAAKDEKPALERASKDEGLNPFTECGIGAMIFDETKWAAVLSNVIWDFGITATTSAVSSKNTCEGKKVAAALFINETYVNIEEETANGGGAHVTAMLNILGCDSAAQQEILSSVRADFGNSVINASYAQKSVTEKAQDYYFLVEKKVSGQYANQCQAS
jgi:DUF3015 family protein